MCNEFLGASFASLWSLWMHTSAFYVHVCGANCYRWLRFVQALGLVLTNSTNQCQPRRLQFLLILTLFSLFSASMPFFNRFNFLINSIVNKKTIRKAKVHFSRFTFRQFTLYWARRNKQLLQIWLLALFNRFPESVQKSFNIFLKLEKYWKEKKTLKLINSLIILKEGILNVF